MMPTFKMGARDRRRPAPWCQVNSIFSTSFCVHPGPLLLPIPGKQGGAFLRESRSFSTSQCSPGQWRRSIALATEAFRDCGSGSGPSPPSPGSSRDQPVHM